MEHFQDHQSVFIAKGFEDLCMVKMIAASLDKQIGID